MFHLLQAFHVSEWMKVVWVYIWKHPHSPLLTTALIINEQNYIEQRVVQDPTFKKYVLDEFYFKAQALLQLNQVIFPIQDKLIGLILGILRIFTNELNLVKSCIVFYLVFQRY